MTRWGENVLLSGGGGGKSPRGRCPGGGNVGGRGNMSPAEREGEKSEEEISGEEMSRGGGNVRGEKCPTERGGGKSDGEMFGGGGNVRGGEMSGGGKCPDTCIISRTTG